MPRPISSRMIRLRAVAPRRIAAVSRISTMNVDSPRARLSPAPTRVNTRSQMPMRALRAATKPPICAWMTASATCRMSVDLPAMFGPVTIRTCSPPESRRTSLGTKLPPAASRSTTGWRASARSMTLPVVDLGPAIAVAVGDLGQRGQRVDRRHPPRERQQPLGRRGDLRAHRGEQLQLQRDALLVGGQDRLLELAQLGGHEALARWRPSACGGSRRGPTPGASA